METVINYIKKLKKSKDYFKKLKIVKKKNAIEPVFSAMD